MLQNRGGLIGLYIRLLKDKRRIIEIEKCVSFYIVRLSNKPNHCLYPIYLFTDRFFSNVNV